MSQCRMARLAPGWWSEICTEGPVEQNELFPQALSSRPFALFKGSCKPSISRRALKYCILKTGLFVTSFIENLQFLPFFSYSKSCNTRKLCKNDFFFFLKDHLHWCKSTLVELLQIHTGFRVLESVVPCVKFCITW